MGEPEHKIAAAGDAKNGLSPQELWQLLNASTPLEVLSLVNAAQKNAKSGLITAREANEITDRSLRYSVARLQLNSTDTSSLPPLQKRLLRGKLDEVFAQLQEESEVGSNDGPKTTPRPNNTPLPKPGPTPATQSIYTFQTNDTSEKITGSPVRRIQNLFETLLDVDTSNLSIEDRKTLELISRQIDSGSFTQSQLNTYYQELDSIRSKAKDLEKAVSDSKSDATWGKEMINNQSSYSHKAGTFGRWGSIADNGCGAIAINNANQIIGFNTDFGDLVHDLNQQPNLTTSLFGKAGMNPLVIGDYYRQNGAEVTLYTNPANVSKDHDVYIALFFHSSGAHYIAAEYNPSTKKFEVYNLDTAEKEKSLVSLSQESCEDTSGWIIWGIDSPVNSNNGYSNSPLNR